MWRYAIERGDDDPARAEFVAQVEARRRAESSQAEAAEAAESTPRRTGTLPVYLL
jgi:hypothetical protein